MNSNKWAALVAAGLTTVSFACVAGPFQLVDDSSATSGIVSEDNGSGVSGNEAPTATNGEPSANGDNGAMGDNQSDDSSGNNHSDADANSDADTDSGSADTATGDDDY